MGALRERVTSGPQGSLSSWADCPRLFAPWKAVLDDAFACCRCILTSLGFEELAKAEMDGELASEIVALSYLIG